MVGKQLAKVDKSTFINYWHHTALQLFKYLVFERIWSDGILRSDQILKFFDQCLSLGYFDDDFNEIFYNIKNQKVPHV